MRLHGYVRIQMVQRAVRLLTALPPALVHTFNLLITATRSLMLLGPGNWHKRIDLGEGVGVLGWKSQPFSQPLLVAAREQTWPGRGPAVAAAPAADTAVPGEL